MGLVLVQACSRGQAKMLVRVYGLRTCMDCWGLRRCRLRISKAFLGRSSPEPPFAPASSVSDHEPIYGSFHRGSASLLSPRVPREGLSSSRFRHSTPVGFEHLLCPVPALWPPRGLFCGHSPDKLGGGGRGKRIWRPCFPSYSLLSAFRA